jgi:small redox-active disulfide protein 2
MTHIEILGPGCQKCQKLYERAVQAAEELGIQYEVTKVTDIERITGYGLLATPALVVNGVVRLSGRVPPAEQLKELLR